MTFMMKPLFFLTTLTLTARAYWLMGAENVLTTQRLDPIVSPGKVGSHVHTIFGGSNFGSVSTAVLRQSQCTSIPIAEDKSNYWVPTLYFQWKNGSFTSVQGGAVMYYLFDSPATGFTAFPDDFRMIAGDPFLRTYNPTSFAQQAVTFLCLDFNGVSTKHAGLPLTACPSGIRAQLNFPSCWDGKNVDSPDHKSHVSYLSQGPDSGSCTDPRYPVRLPRIFMELYWGTGDFDVHRGDAMNTTQPFVFSYGDRTGYGYHGDFINGWDAGVLQKAVNNCHCNIYGDPTCCSQQGIFTLKPGGQNCRITPTVDEQVEGTIPQLPGNNPVQEEGAPAVPHPATYTPPIMSPVYVYTGNTPTQTGSIVAQASGVPVPASPSPQIHLPSGTSPSPTATPNSHPASTPSMPASSPNPGYPAPSPSPKPSDPAPPKPPVSPTAPGVSPQPSQVKPSPPPPAPLVPPGQSPSSSSCEAAATKTVTVTVTVSNNHKHTPSTPPVAPGSTPSHSNNVHPAPAPSSTPTEDPYCDEMDPSHSATPSVTPSYHYYNRAAVMKSSRSLRARHNAGRRLLQNDHSF